MNLVNRLKLLESRIAPESRITIVIEEKHGFYGDTNRLRDCIARRIADTESGRFVPVPWEGKPGENARILEGWKAMLKELNAITPAPTGIVVADRTALTSAEAPLTEGDN